MAHEKPLKCLLGYRGPAGGKLRSLYSMANQGGRMTLLATRAITPVLEGAGAPEKPSFLPPQPRAHGTPDA